MKMKLWPNGLGLDFGRWEIWKPDSWAGRSYYQANYFPHNGRFATHTGSGNTVGTAIHNAHALPEAG